MCHTLYKRFTGPSSGVHFSRRGNKVDAKSRLQQALTISNRLREQHPRDSRYLHQLASAYTQFFYHFDSAPLVIVNAAEIDLAHGDDDYNLLFEQLQTIRKGRHYLNPLPF